MPARAAPECAMPGMPLRKSAVMLTMAPPCCWKLCRNSSRIIRKPPVRLLATTASKPRLLMAISGAGNWPPALLTRPWTAPSLAIDVGHAGLDGLVVADVERAPGAAAAVLADLGGHALELVGAAAADDDVGAERRQLVRDRAADARAAAGDPDALAGEQARGEHAAIARRGDGGGGRNGRGCRHGTRSIPGREGTPGGTCRIRLQGDVNVNLMSRRELH